MSDPTAAPGVAGADTDLDMLFAEAEALREFAVDQKAHDEGELYSFSVRWGALLFGRLERLAHYSTKRELSSRQQQRYDALRAELAQLLPVIDTVGLPRPPVPLAE
jgi:hypothetical protein